MARLKIVKFGDPTLRKVSRPVTEITPRVITLLEKTWKAGRVQRVKCLSRNPKNSSPGTGFCLLSILAPTFWP